MVAGRWPSAVTLRTRMPLRVPAGPGTGSVRGASLTVRRRIEAAAQATGPVIGPGRPWTRAGGRTLRAGARARRVQAMTTAIPAGCVVMRNPNAAPGRRFNGLPATAGRRGSACFSAIHTDHTRALCFSAPPPLAGEGLGRGGQRLALLPASPSPPPPLPQGERGDRSLGAETRCPRELPVCVDTHAHAGRWAEKRSGDRYQRCAGAKLKRAMSGRSSRSSRRRRSRSGVSPSALSASRAFSSRARWAGSSPISGTRAGA